MGSSTAPSKKRKQHKDIVYPIFVKCAELPDTADEWKELFNNLARDILPKGFSVRNKTLAYTDNYRTTPVRMDIEPSALREQLIELFSSKKGFALRPISESTEPTILPSTWKEVKKKVTRRIYILERVCEHGRSQGWSEEKIDEAYAKVESWLELGCVRQNEVTMVDGAVSSISDILFTPEGVELNQCDAKRKIPIQRVHISRLYQPLRRLVVKKEAVKEITSEDTSTAT